MKASETAFISFSKEAYSPFRHLFKEYYEAG